MFSRSPRPILAASFLLLAFLYLCHFDLGRQQVSQVDVSGHDQKGRADLSQSVKLLEILPKSSSSFSTIISKPTSSAQKDISPPATQSPEASVSPQDVLLITKTGASTLWRRMPLHLTTTLFNVPNFVIYSDQEEQLSSNISTINVLANETAIIQTYDLSAYESYLDLQSPSHINTFREHAHLPGDEPQSPPGQTPGWRLDRYKFLPMLKHAQRNWPDLKWYIYIEDDTFIFLDNLLRWLGRISPDGTPSYYGAAAGDGNKTFAQGGSGIVFSRSLMRSIFSGNNVPDLEKYGNETSQACCGDIMLGKVLRDYGVKINGGKYGTVSFRPEPPWKTGFDRSMWCEKVFSFHHLHGKERVVLSELERKLKQKGQPVIFRDVFKLLIYPYVQQPMLTNWDSLASKHILTNHSSLHISLDMGPLSASSLVFQRASESSEACQNACMALYTCMTWRYEKAERNKCALDDVVRLGRETNPLPQWEEEKEVTSGWILDRIERDLMQEKCEVMNNP